MDRLLASGLSTTPWGHCGTYVPVRVHKIEARTKERLALQIAMSYSLYGQHPHPLPFAGKITPPESFSKLN